MSADNGVYILDTPRGNHGAQTMLSRTREYRVNDFQAIENLFYDQVTYTALHPKDELGIIYLARLFMARP